MQSRSFTSIIRLFVIMIFLWIINYIIQRLPMLTDLYIEDIGMTLASLGKMIVFMIMIFVIWNFGREFAPELRKLIPAWPESASLLKAIIFLISVVIAYSTFLPIAYKFIRDFWIYQLVFGILAIFPVVQGGLILYRSVDKITTKVEDQATRMASVQCVNCGSLNPPSGKFCQTCGKEVSKKLEDAKTQKCPKCGAENQPIAKFCINCGDSMD